MTAGWGSRTTRAAMFAAVCVLLAALGHVMMSDSRVPSWALVAGAAATGAVGWCLAGRERGLPLITSAVVAAQTALHWGFEPAQSSAPTATNGLMGSTTLLRDSAEQQSLREGGPWPSSPPPPLPFPVPRGCAPSTPLGAS